MFLIHVNSCPLCVVLFSVAIASSHTAFFISSFSHNSLPQQITLQRLHKFPIRLFYVTRGINLLNTSALPKYLKPVQYKAGTHLHQDSPLPIPLHHCRTLALMLLISLLK